MINLSSSRAIAIVGMGGVLPGAASLDAFWANVLAGRDAAGDVPPGRWPLAPDEVYASHPSPDKVYSRRACLVDPFTPHFPELALAPELIASLDPMFHLALEAGQQAWRDAKMDAVDRSRVGVVLGNIALPTDAASALADEQLGVWYQASLTGKPPAEKAPRTESLNRYVAGLPAGVLAKSLDLGGGSFALDAACASSLYALKLAADQLQTGRVDAMLAGGLSRPDSLYTQMGFSQLGALSPSGRCAPFDESADGLVVGEGAGIFVLRRLEDAIHDGQHIYAVIRGIGLSNDVGGNLMLPDSEGQLRAMRAAYQEAAWNPSDVQLFECHGTGTPVGDAVELNSLTQLWKGTSPPAKKAVVGSVKSNVGHLLTGAGAAALLKVLLALKARQLPPTANVSQPTSKIDWAKSPFHVLSTPEDWTSPATGAPRRAAVSAFGFGGINAHVLLEQWVDDSSRTSVAVADSNFTSRSFTTREQSVRAASPPHPTSIAVVGMGAHVGPWDSLATFTQRVLGGDRDRAPTTPTRRWGTPSAESFRGHFIESLEFPLTQFRIPPTELRQMLPQQLLMLKVAAEALADARIQPGTESPLRTGVFIGIELDPNTTNFHLRWMLQRQLPQWAAEMNLAGSDAEMADWLAKARDAVSPPLTANRTMGALGGIVASRIARAFRIGGPSFTISSGEVSGLSALGVAVAALQRGEIDTAIVGAVDPAGDLRAVLGQHDRRPFSKHDEPWPFSVETDGPLIGEGAVALILKRHADEQGHADRVYATIRGYGNATGDGVDCATPSHDACTIALNEALGDGAIAAETIGYVETHGSGHPNDDRREADVLTSAFGVLQQNRNVAIGSTKAAVGHAGAASGLVSVVKACLCLHHQIIPPLAPSTPRHSSVIQQGGSLSVPSKPYAWLHDRAAGPRRAVVGSLSVDGNASYVVLEAESSSQPCRHVALESEAKSEAVFAFEADDPNAILRRLNQLRSLASTNNQLEIESLVRRWYNNTPAMPNAKLAVAIIAGTPTQLDARIDEAHGVVSSGSTAVGPHVFFTPHPLGCTGDVAFVYPGSGNHFADMGRELALAWPEVLHRLEHENNHLATQFAGGDFWSRGALREATPKNLILSQVWVGSLVTDVLRHLGVHPQAILGYSLGETTGLLATRTWTDRDELLSRMQASPLFTHQLAGERTAARQVWGLSPQEPCDWYVGVVNKAVDDVRKAVAQFARVYLLIINTPTQCVIGGPDAEVAAVVRALKCNVWPLDGVSTVHCQLAKPVEEAYRAFHRFDTTPPPNVRFYSSAWGRSYDVTPDTAADALVAQAVNSVDFTRVVSAAYEDGARVFVEVGPGTSCTRMIDEILGSRPHVAQSVCAPGADGPSSVRHLLALLISHRVPVDLPKSFLHAHDSPQDAPPQATLTISLDRPPCELPPMQKAIQKVPIESPTESVAIEPPIESTVASSQSNPLPMALHRSERSSTDRLSTAPPHVRENGTVLTPLIDAVSAAAVAETEAQQAYVSLSNFTLAQLERSVEFQMSLLRHTPPKMPAATALETPVHGVTPPKEPAGSSSVGHVEEPQQAASHPDRIVLNRDQCLEFAVGSIGIALGKRFAEVDRYPSRVRLPDEPLMLVDRILHLEGEPLSLAAGRVVTEHDILPDAWYLDNRRIPTCIAVEAGQADLLLSAYLGIDFETQGTAVYRLLDAVITFHRELPGPGSIVHYDIRIERFFRQGDTYLFRFRFDATVDGELLLTMREGCAGFFSAAALATGQGIVTPTIDLRTQSDVQPSNWAPPVPMAVEAYDDAQLDKFRQGDLAGCFGDAFAHLQLNQPAGLPAGKMKLVDRILRLDPQGGTFSLGTIVGEADIHPDDWFLTCHFVDDQVMPGTLMYECCLHTLRVFLSRMGWVGEASDVVYEPVPEIAGSLKCRGQVTAATQQVQYEITMKELGYREPDDTPYVVADALMHADGKPVVQMKDMSLRLTGLTRHGIETLWNSPARGNIDSGEVRETKAAASDPPAALFDYDRIHAFALGKPSEAFGEPYRVFDEQRVIARLPGPPFQFLDRITSIANCEPWRLEAGGEIIAQYDVPPDAWYFDAHRQGQMPFSVLLEIGLQPCGWIAAYLGSALTSDIDMSFRNLGGTGTQTRAVTPDTGTLSTKVKITSVANSGGMIIQNYNFAVHSAAGEVYRGQTNFGFFSHDALRQQVGIRDVAGYAISEDERLRGDNFDFPHQSPFPDRMLRMVDHIDHFDPEGGPHKLGFVRGTAKVDPSAWFFKAHFHQDPVWPGSLGLESYLQLLALFANRRWGRGGASPTFETLSGDKPHAWQYRGQIIPEDDQVTIEAVITEIDDRRQLLRANGLLCVDGRTIYQMTDFTIRLQA